MMETMLPIHATVTAKGALALAVVCTIAGAPTAAFGWGWSQSAPVCPASPLTLWTGNGAPTDINYVVTSCSGGLITASGNPFSSVSFGGQVPLAATFVNWQPQMAIPDTFGIGAQGQFYRLYDDLGFFRPNPPGDYDQVLATGLRTSYLARVDETENASLLNHQTLSSVPGFQSWSADEGVSSEFGYLGMAFPSFLWASRVASWKTACVALVAAEVATLYSGIRAGFNVLRAATPEARAAHFAAAMAYFAGYVIAIAAATATCTAQIPAMALELAGYTTNFYCEASTITDPDAYPACMAAQWPIHHTGWQVILYGGGVALQAGILALFVNAGLSGPF